MQLLPNRGLGNINRATIIDPENHPKKNMRGCCCQGGEAERESSGAAPCSEREEDWA